MTDFQPQLGTCAFSYECAECHEATILHLPFNDVARWRGGELIQRVFPQLSEDVRELMISGICGKCFDQLFDGEEGQHDDEAPAF